ncbi:hypothetical protein GH733_014040 [Mirounga leonina]|nr:hypothetical protein GH733_014040 [Mirounga leonina]
MLRTPHPAALPTSPADCPSPTSRSISTPAASAPYQQSSLSPGSTARCVPTHRRNGCRTTSTLWR